MGEDVRLSRWLGIDHGTKRIGVAVGDTEEGIASPVETVPAEPFAGALRRIREIAAEYLADGIVVGWALNMDDSEGPQAKITRHAAEQLARATGLDVRLWDERLSSFAADDALAGSFTRKQKRRRQDAVAAAEVLRDFLSAGGPETAPRPADLGD